MDEPTISASTPSLASLHRELLHLIADALSALELIELANPTSTPLVALARDHLHQALRTISSATDLEQTVTRLLSSPFPVNQSER